MIDLNEIMAVCEAATPRPWESRVYQEGPYETWGVQEVSPRGIRQGWIVRDAHRDETEFIARARTWLPALVAELTQAREELAAVDESLGDFYAPVLDPETEEPCGSFWKDHGVWVMRDALELAHAEIERLQALVPSLELLYRIHVGADSEYIEEVLALARRIEEANTDEEGEIKTALTPEAASRIWERMQQLEAEAKDDNHEAVR